MKIFYFIPVLMMLSSLAFSQVSDKDKDIKFSQRIPLELILEVKVKKSMEIGYAYCFSGEVISVTKGKLEDKRILVTVMAGDTTNYGRFSHAGEDDLLKISFIFNKSNEPYSTTYITGFVDSEKNSWRITDILK